MGIPEEGGGVWHRGFKPDDHVVAAGRYGLSDPGQAGRHEPLHEVVGDPSLQVVGARHIPPHGVHARTADKISEDRYVFGHDPHPTKPPFRPARFLFLPAGFSLRDGGSRAVVE